VTKRIPDIDLMQYLDGELPADEAREVGAALSSDSEAQRALRSMQQLGECLRTHAELEVDEADAALARVWEQVEERLQDGKEGEAAAVPSPAPVPRPRQRELGLWARFGEWLDQVRGYFVTGAVAAAAAAALVLVLSGGGEAPGVAGAPAPSSGVVMTQPASLTSQPPEVESLEIYGASGSVLTIPSGDSGGGTTVIWLDRDSPTEGPI
jgi:negative regulator of sigma E activity